MAKFPLETNPRVIVLEVNFIGPSGKAFPLKMILDTGASITTMPAQIAIAIGCDPSRSKRRVEMITASGIEYAPMVTIPRIELLGFKLKNIEVICHELPPRAFVSGLLGMNILKKFDIFLKFRKRILEITQ